MTQDDARLPDASEDHSNLPFLWLQTSEATRRGRCIECGSPLVFDHQWFEPSTLWIVDPVVLIGNNLVGRAEKYFGGTYDADVCWASRHVPVPESMLEARVDCGDFFSVTSDSGQAQDSFTGDDEDSPPASGREQFDDFDWASYFVDPGKL